MPLEEFIITVFCWVETQVDDMTQTVKLRQRGYPPRLRVTQRLLEQGGHAVADIVGRALQSQGIQIKVAFSTNYLETVKKMGVGLEHSAPKYSGY